MGLAGIEGASLNAEARERPCGRRSFRSQQLQGKDPERGVEPPKVYWVTGDDRLVVLSGVDDDAGIDKVARASLTTKDAGNNDCAAASVCPGPSTRRNV